MSLEGFDVHIGTYDGDAVGDFVPAGVRVFHDGDSWEDWGEPRNYPVEEVDTDYAGKEHPEHIILRYDKGTDLEKMLSDFAFIQNNVTLEFMRFEYQRGVVMTITSSKDWSEEYFYFKSTYFRNNYNQEMNYDY